MPAAQPEGDATVTIQVPDVPAASWLVGVESRRGKIPSSTPDVHEIRKVRWKPDDERARNALSPASRSYIFPETFGNQ